MNISEYDIVQTSNHDFEIYDKNGNYIDSEESHEAAIHLIERLEENK